MRKRLALFTMLTLLAVAAFGCAAPPIENAPVGGNIQFRVTDAPRGDNVTAVYIEVNPVDGIQVHRAGSDNTDEPGDWISANITGPNPFELLALKGSDGIFSILGDAHLASGNYTQMRLDIKSVTVTINGENQTATVPSDKLKFNRPFEVIDGGTTIVTFDFDADKSINVTGNGHVMMKPVINLIVEKAASGQAISISPTELPAGTVDVPYSAALQATGGTGNYTWTFTGSLPSGLSINSTSGLISGTPDAAGTSHFTVKVSDNATPANMGSRPYSITINAAGTLTITPTTLPNADSGQPYGPITLVASGGTGTYTWSIVSGTLPSGMTFDLVNGVLDGTPVGSGQTNFTVQVQDGASHTGTQPYTLTFN
jgi:hypothetical protein